MTEMSKTWPHMTLDEEQSLRRTFEEEERQRIAKFAALKAEDHHTHCRDCGRFLDKSRWLSKASAWALRGQRPLCAPCFGEYDFDHG
ncbi:hypothetical protein [Pseudomonas sp. KCJK8927]|uniref:hypothetical protein n=1 Tax=Pseudomonas sp. KCJK8927 TaxID=3344560 RepID=UPI0039066275